MMALHEKSLPPGWVTAPLSDVAEVNPPNPNSVPADDALVSFVPMAAVEAATGRLDPEERRAWGDVRTGYKRFQDGDILFAKITPCMENGKVAIATGLLGGVGAGSTEYHVLRPNGAAIPKLLLHYLLQDDFRKDAQRSMTGTAGQLRVPERFLLESSLPVPPLGEQERIIEALEAHLSDLDAAVAALERVKANLERYRASVLKAAVEGRLVPTEAELARQEGREYEPADVLLERILKERRRRWEEAELAKLRAKGKEPTNDKWKAKYKDPAPPDTTNLPPLPKGWCWATIDQLANVGTGATPKRGEPRYYADGSVPWVTSGALHAPNITSATESVTEAAFKETNLTRYPVGTILVAMYGEGKTRGKHSELAIEATTNQAIAALVLSGLAEPCRRYLRLFLTHNYVAVRRLSSGGVQPNLNLSIVRKIAIPLPPLTEQEIIVAMADEQLSICDELVPSAEAQILRAQRLRQATLHWAFEGKLVDQDPNDEPASALLERIRAERERLNGQQKQARRGRGRKKKGAKA